MTQSTRLFLDHDDSSLANRVLILAHEVYLMHVISFRYCYYFAPIWGMFITEKEFRFETSDGKQLSPYIREFFTSESQTIFTWPCAVLLASYIVTCDVTKGRRTIELGAGCGLPSIVAALCGAKACVITERAEEPLVLQNLEMNVVKNCLCGICSVVRNSSLKKSLIQMRV